MAEEPERKRPEVHWRDLVKACRSIRHVVSSGIDQWSWMSFNFHVPEQGSKRIKLIQRWKISFDQATSDDDHDEEVFRNVDAELRRLRKERPYKGSTLIKNCFYKTVDFDPYVWNRGEMTLIDFIREARASWEKRTTDRIDQELQYLNNLVQVLEKSRQEIGVRFNLLEIKIFQAFEQLKQETDQRLRKLETQVEDLSQPPNLQ